MCVPRLFLVLGGAKRIPAYDSGPVLWYNLE